ncbi:hypothetical protein PAECIP111890_05903 [Paenibacillus sp. JJ-223]|nr:hypothetical protein PAECIP111890_05903 [Paenibacillus sp. JJ-223]
MPVVFSNDPTKQYMVRYTGDLPIDRVRGLGTFKLPFVAYDPWAYKETTSDLLRWDTDYTWEDDFAWDEGYSFDFRDPGEVEINNLGILNAEPIIEIIGTFSSLSLTVGGVVFTYNIPMSGI